MHTMIRTRSFQSDTTFDPGMLVPPPTSVVSPTFQMPHVFVHPPEEEQSETPPWCFFDADNDGADQLAAFTSPEMATMEAKLGIWEEVVDAWEHPVIQSADDAPAFRRTGSVDADVVMPRRGSVYHNRAESPPPEAMDYSPKRAKEDEDVVEVVKVPRSYGMRDVGDAQQAESQSRAHGGLKKSKTFRARASQAFRSIKNVGKTTKKPAAQDIFPAKENAAATMPRAESMREVRREVWDIEDPPVARATTPKLKRRMSRPLSQMFGMGPSGASTEPEPAPSAPLYPTASSSTSRRLSSYSVGSSYTLRPSAEESASRPVSPSFSTAPSSRRRFSFVNLQGLFSNSNPTPPLSTSPAATNDSLPSTAGPQTPVDDDDEPRRFSIPAAGSLDIDVDERELDSRKSSSSNLGSAGSGADADEPPERDISFEMRLDSLHFDSLSFDADNFGVAG